MTAEQVKILQDCAEFLSTTGDDQEAWLPERDAILAALAEITRLKERERVLADGLRASAEMDRLELEPWPVFRQKLRQRDANRATFVAALKLLDDTV